MLPTSAFAQGQREVQQGPAAEVPRTLRAAAPIDLTGTWVSIVSEDWRWRMMTPPRYDYAAVPMNADARRVADNWDPAADEAGGQQCKIYGAAAVMRVPGRLRIGWADDNTLKVETDAGAQTRMLRYGASQAGSERVPGRDRRTRSGRYRKQTGRGGRGGPRSGQLKTVTTNLRAGYLRTNGVPYSENAVVTEYYVRVTAPNGDEWLVVTSIVDDPTVSERAVRDELALQEGAERREVLAQAMRCTGHKRSRVPRRPIRGCPSRRSTSKSAATGTTSFTRTCGTGVPDCWSATTRGCR